MEHVQPTTELLVNERQIYDAKELELTFAVNRIPLEFLYGSASLPTMLDDLYVPSSDDDIRPRLKFRRAKKQGIDGKHGKGNYLMVIKDPLHGSDLPYYNKLVTALTPGEFHLIRAGLDDLRAVRSVVKDRYRFDVGGHRANLYVYQGPLYGLVTVSFKRLSRKGYNDLLAEPPADFVGDRADMLIGCVVAGKRFKDLSKQCLGLVPLKRLDPAKFGLRRL